jgi:hypothetical protein
MINITNFIFDSSSFFFIFSGVLVIISKFCIGLCYGCFFYIMLHNKGYNLNILKKLSINDLVFILLTLYSFVCIIF